MATAETRTTPWRIEDLKVLAWTTWWEGRCQCTVTSGWSWSQVRMGADLVRSESLDDGLDLERICYPLLGLKEEAERSASSAAGWKLWGRAHEAEVEGEGVGDGEGREHREARAEGAQVLGVPRAGIGTIRALSVRHLAKGKVAGLGWSSNARSQQPTSKRS